MTARVARMDGMAGNRYRRSRGLSGNGPALLRPGEVHGATPSPGGPAMKASDPSDLGTRYAAAWGSQDPESLASFFSEKGTLTVNSGTPTVGRAEIAETVGGFMAAFPDMVVAMESVPP
ncbi:MAG: hypothetical protein GF346_13085 [Candidatus Eisenbacteria bacterium]|nr:hypothetical protein [Candidatus Latescibacterota bacterium]MBD3303373.1 hypothetical protein [Candidatus Eisenbacteria bacterium]